MTRLLNFLCDEDAATAVEYAVVAALVIGVSIAAISYVGNMVSETFNGVAEAIDGKVNRP